MIASIGIGGAEKHVLDLCLQQLALGADVKVALPGVGALSQALLDHNIDFQLIRAGGRWHPLSLWSLHQAIRSIRPDLIHAHMLKSAAMVRYANRRIPYVATAHNIVKHLGPFRSCHHVICVSKMVQDSMVQLGYPISKTTVVHNAVETQAFSTLQRDEIRRQHGWHNQLIILCVARLVPAKGQIYAIEALAKLIKQLPSIKLVLVGEGPDRDQLMQYAQKIGVSTHLSLLGARNDVAALLSATDIYLQPSLKEGFCIAFLEAMATGLCCIGTQTGAIPNMVKSGVNGLLIAPGASDAIADAILSMTKDTETRSRYARAAKITVQTQFSLEKQASDTLAVYQQVLMQ